MSEPAEALTLSDRNTEALESNVWDYLWDLDAQHTTLMSDIPIWWQWYEATPQVRTKTFPWRGASNVILPVIRTAVDSLVAQAYATIYSHNKLFSAHSDNEGFKDYIAPITEFMNWAGEHEFEMSVPLLDWLIELHAIGESVLRLEWRRQERWVRVPGSTQPIRASLNRGPIVSHVPRHQMLWDVGKTIDDAEVVSRQALLTFSDMARHAQFDGWDPEAVEASRGQWDTASSGYHIERERAEAAGRQLEPNFSDDRLHDVREVWVDTPMLGAMDEKLGQQAVDAKVSTLVVNYHMGSRRILKVTPDPYGLGHKPFYWAAFRKRGGNPTGEGLCKILEHGQRAMSTMFNQAIDAVTLNNSFPFLTDDPKLANAEFSPGKPLFTTSPKGFVLLNQSRNVLPENQMVNLMQVFNERVSGSNDPLQGRESRSGGHPSPATNFLGMEQRSKILTSPTMRMIRKAISSLAADVATMYQLFDTDDDGRLTRTLGDEDGNKVKEWLFPTSQPIIGNMAFDVFAVDEEDNPQVRQQRAILVSQLTNNYYAQVLPLAQQAANPKMPPKLKAMIEKAIEANTESFINFLENSGIDNIKAYALQEGDTNGQGLPDILRALTGGQGGQGPLQQRSVGGPAPSANGGAQPPNGGVASFGIE
jgi:hypothetical protein